MTSSGSDSASVLSDTDTLVPSSTNEITTLILTPDNPSNTTITVAGADNLEKVLYTVKTTITKKATVTVTEVYNANDDLVASLEWRDVLPDKVTYGKAKPVSLWTWMQKSVIPFKDDVTFLDDSGRSYKWRGNSPGRSLELFCAEDDYRQPIAQFRKSRKDHKTNPVSWTPATLALDARAMQIADLVVTSFLFIEKSHRTNQTTSQNRADVLGAPALNGGNYMLRDGGV